jgi:molecular chaperone DnaJ
MRLSEAYKELGLSEGTSKEDAKKKYRELVKNHHPDVSKDPKSEDKIKKINEAYKCIQEGKGSDRTQQSGWSPFHRQQVIQLEHVETYLTIDFKEAVLGCQKELKYSRQTKCATCEGSGDVRVDNGCKKCGGKGMVFISTCPECQGRSSTIDCLACHGDGNMNSEVVLNISVPAGTLNGSTLRLQGMGNYAGSIMGLGFMDQYTDAFCHVTVIPEAGLSIEGRDVISNVSISLLEALKGCHKTIKTIFGQKEIIIKPLSRHREEVIISNHGVEGSGNQRVILEVSYPQDVSTIMSALEAN